MTIQQTEDFIKDLEKLPNEIKNFIVSKKKFLKQIGLTHVYTLKELRS